MKKMVSKIIFFFILGFLFPLYTLCMQTPPNFEAEKENSDDYQLFTPTRKTTKIDGRNSPCFMTSEHAEIPLPKSYEALHASVEHLLYEFCDVADPGLRIQEEAKKNKEYYLKSSKAQTQRSFSVQPVSDLKHQLGYEIEDWLLRREKEISEYVEANTELREKEGFQSKSPSHTNEVLCCIAEQNHHAILNRLKRKHGPREVMLGKREATEEEVTSLKRKINAKERPAIITKPRGYLSRSLAVGTAYAKDHDGAKVEGFILKPKELSRAYKRLKLLSETLTREHKILKEIAVYFDENFLPKVGGWRTSQVINWVALNKIIYDAQTELKDFIEKKYPFPPYPGNFARDRTTDRGVVLAYLNEDERGKKLRGKVLVQINRGFLETSGQDHRVSAADVFFSRIYCGVDELELKEVEEGCHIGTKYPHPRPVTVKFAKVKSRNYILDEERYKIRLLCEDPTAEDFTHLRPNEMALYLKEGQLHCKVEHEAEKKIDILTKKRLMQLWSIKEIWSLNQLPWDIFWEYFFINRGLRQDVYVRLQKAVQDNKEPTPDDRRALLDFMVFKKYIHRLREPWQMPKNTEMVQEYPSHRHVLGHQKFWREVMREFRQKNRPIITDDADQAACEVIAGYNMITSYESLYDLLVIPSLHQPTYIVREVKDYNTLYGTYEILLREHVHLLREMQRGYGALSYIPAAVKFFISESYVEKPPIPTVPSSAIDLSGLTISDHDFQGKRLTPQGYEFMLYCYYNVDLSHNFLTGRGDYHLAHFITTLNLSNNHISSLDFLSGLSALKSLNLSKNSLTNVSAFCRFAKSGDEWCQFLQELDLSENAIEDIEPLSVLRWLKKLDVSNNKLKTLRSLHPVEAVSSPNEASDVTVVEGAPRKADRTMRESLITCLKASHNVLRGNLKKVFGEGFTNLKILEIEGNSPLILPEKPYYFFNFFPNLKALKTDASEEAQMSKEPKKIDLCLCNLRDKNIAIRGKTLKTRGEDVLEQEHPLFFYVWINLSGNYLSGENIRGNNFYSEYIVKLEIRENVLSDLEFIAGFPNLMHFDASDNDIKDASPVGKCLALEYLDLSHNKVSDLKFIESLLFLEVLKVNNNGFSRFFAEIFPRQSTSVKKLDIGNNAQLEFQTFSIWRDTFPALEHFFTEESQFGVCEYIVDKDGIFKPVEYG